MIGFGLSVAINGKTMVIGAHIKDNCGAVYVFTLQGKTWTEEKKLTASDGKSYDDFGRIVAISRNTLLVGDYVKCF